MELRVPEFFAADECPGRSIDAIAALGFGSGPLFVCRARGLRDTAGLLRREAPEVDASRHSLWAV